MSHYIVVLWHNREIGYGLIVRSHLCYKHIARAARAEENVFVIVRDVAISKGCLAVDESNKLKTESVEDAA